MQITECDCFFICRIYEWRRNEVESEVSNCRRIATAIGTHRKWQEREGIFAGYGGATRRNARRKEIDGQNGIIYIWNMCDKLFEYIIQWLGYEQMCDGNAYDSCIRRTTSVTVHLYTATVTHTLTAANLCDLIFELERCMYVMFYCIKC